MTGRFLNADSAQGMYLRLLFDISLKILLTLMAFRLGHNCRYDDQRGPFSGPTVSSSPSPQADAWNPSTALTLDDVRRSIIQKLQSSTPEAIIALYCNYIETWFPILSTSRLRDKVPRTWGEVSLDVALLYLSIDLVTVWPEVDTDPTTEIEVPCQEFTSTYLQIKSSLALIEGLGVNSFQVIQSRLLLTLFEVAHGFYPAAYISIGAAVRALDALEISWGTDNLAPGSLPDDVKHEYKILTWCGVLILDR